MTINTRDALISAMGNNNNLTNLLNPNNLHSRSAQKTSSVAIW